MVDDNKKFITVSFVLAGVLVAFTSGLLIELLAQNFAVITRLSSNPTFSNGLPVALGLALFLVLQFNSHTVEFMDGVVGELKKVVWPSRKDTGVMTVVVVITLIIAGVIVGLLDSASAYIINLFVK